MIRVKKLTAEFNLVIFLELIGNNPSTIIGDCRQNKNKE
jgi:hypothetical protein